MKFACDIWRFLLILELPSSLILKQRKKKSIQILIFFGFFYEVLILNHLVKIVFSH